MAVSVLGYDPCHTKLHADVTAAQAAVTAGGGSALKLLVADELRRAQIAEVNYCMVTGRLDPAKILSTLT